MTMDISAQSRTRRVSTVGGQYYPLIKVRNHLSASIKPSLRVLTGIESAFLAQRDFDPSVIIHPGKPSPVSAADWPQQYEQLDDRINQAPMLEITR